MLILRPYETHVLMPVPMRQWRSPSAAVPKDEFGNEVEQTRFRLTARLSDGHVRWRGFFDSRDDFDAFLWTLVRFHQLGEPIPQPMWRLPTPAWHPDLDVGVIYAVDTLIFLTSTSGGTWTSVIDWDNTANSVERVGGGGGSGCGSGAFHATGGGGGAYRRTPNFVVAAPGTTTVPWDVGLGGSGQAFTGSSGRGTNGGDTWWVSSAAGNIAAGGNAGDVFAGSVNGGSGGSAGTPGTGETVSAGGNGGNLTGATGNGASGGGGAGGPSGAGGFGGNSASTVINTVTDGGFANGGSVPGGTSGADGNNGNLWDSSHGPGSGGAGAAAAAVNTTAGSGGSYGGAGAGCRTGATNQATSGTGRAGIIAITYTPRAISGMLMMF